MPIKARRLQEEFQFFVDELTEKEMLIDLNPLVAAESEKQTRLSWTTDGGLAYLLTEHSSIEQYIEVLNRRDFSLCLKDGGLLQVDYTIKNSEITHHRLCYMPCPFQFELSEWPGVAIAEIPSLMSAADLIRDARLASPIRFDFDIDFSDDKHAHSHLTINKKTCRIPAYGPVSLGHFFRFILRYFYESDFDRGPWLSEIRPKLFTRTLNHPSPHEIHIESAIGYD
ncbi:DUF2290 domain-containing protein [Burkholderia cenocepacia]|uniref:DUF2290 domain-containing protein n=1 Tax=Burkholderia cepacia complex TaxID=87882 RepID=UPI0009C14D58|nr:MULTISPECIES: DUF2290 domain-containing protein [Burkholderia cepacia complex]MCF1367091.1 DUF2290 domain-containing protein [Burkholderia cenocepacia]MCF1384624.1 DUF2290 domain-containing protein [Burkholderia cenocepacia]